MDDLTHIDSSGDVHMVDVGSKPTSHREAMAEATVYMSLDTLQKIRQGNLPKGSVISAAKLAGIMAAKRTWELIPLCHNIALSSVNLDLEFIEDPPSIRLVSIVRTEAQTGVEMEALTAVSVAALTIYDMSKAVERGMVIGDIRLLKKIGGVHGEYKVETK